MVHHSSHVSYDYEAFIVYVFVIPNHFPFFIHRCLIELFFVLVLQRILLLFLLFLLFLLPHIIIIIIIIGTAEWNISRAMSLPPFLRHLSPQLTLYHQPLRPRELPLRTRPLREAQRLVTPSTGFTLTIKSLLLRRTSKRSLPTNSSHLESLCMGTSTT